MTTFSTLVSRVLRAIKVKSTDTDTTLFVKDSINQALYELAREKKIPELLKMNFEMLLTDNAEVGPTFLINGVGPGVGLIALPPDFLALERVIWHMFLGAQEYSWELSPREENSTPSLVHGYPARYSVGVKWGIVSVNEGQQSGNFAIKVEPYATNALITKSLFLDYYVIPETLTDNSDELPTSLWDEEIIRRASAAYWNQNNRVPQANFLLGKSNPAQQ